jgi:AcrR family transcriptional regulator
VFIIALPSRTSVPNLDKYNNMTTPTQPKRPRESHQERTARTRAALCDALLQLLQEKPFEQIITREITSTAKVGYATFFRHYNGKDELLHDLASGEIRRLLGMTLPIFYAVDSKASTEAVCAYVWEHRQLWRALLTGGAASILKEEYLRQALAVPQDYPSLEMQLPADLAVTVAVSALIEVHTWWLKQDTPPPLKTISDLTYRLAILPVMPHTSSKTR